MKEFNKKIDLLNNQLIDEKKKNSILSKEIYDLNNKLKESNIKIDLLNNQFIDEKSKNKLISKINEKNNNEIIQDEIYKLYKKIKDLNEKIKRYPFILKENEKLISIIISSINKKINYSMICKNTFTINDLEKEIYKEYPEISGTENIFMFNGKIINREETFESNNIKNGDTLILNQKEVK